MDIVQAEAIAVGDRDLLPVTMARVTDHVFDIDFESTATDGWELARLSSALRPVALATIQDAARVFERALQTIRGRHPECVYVFGTGPSLSRAIENKYPNGAIVVCNTIVKDESLWNHLNPDILVAGDAIYHFGHTAHARAFRHDALARLSAPGSSTLFVYPAMFDPVVRMEFASVADRLVPIPMGEHEDVTVDLSRHFALPQLGNVLNLLLLPVGCTISHQVRLWGFDGRAPADVLFWANSDRQSYPDLLQTVRDAHPAFFLTMVPAGRESQYVKSVHGDVLDDQLSDAEGRGFGFEMMHFSWTPTLQKRGRAARPEQGSTSHRTTGND